MYLMLGLSETMDQLAMPHSAVWYGHVLRMVLEFEVEGQRTNSRLKRTWKRQVVEEQVKVGLRRKDAVC